MVEVDDEGLAFLRFGNGDQGEAPAPGTNFQVSYRVGNGTAGNVPAERILRTLNLPDPTILAGVRNPLPASGGIDPEPSALVKMLAPGAFRSGLLRAITADDYATIAEQYPGVQRAAATIRWTGGLREVLVAIDPLGTDDPAPELIEEVAASLESFRRIEQDVKVVQGYYVGLDVAMDVTVQPNYFAGTSRPRCFKSSGAR